MVFDFECSRLLVSSFTSFTVSSTTLLLLLLLLMTRHLIFRHEIVKSNESGGTLLKNKTERQSSVLTHQDSQGPVRGEIDRPSVCSFLISSQFP
jgi:hypothetical protein